MTDHPFDRLAAFAWDVHTEQPDQSEADYLRTATWALEDALDNNQDAQRLARDVLDTIAAITGDSRDEVLAGLPGVEGLL